MMSRSLAIALVAGGCMTAAAGGSYLAVRHNAQPAPPPTSVNESEGVISPDAAPVDPVPGPVGVDPEPVETERKVVDPPAEPRVVPRKPSMRRAAAVRVSTRELPVETASPARERSAAVAAPAAVPVRSSVDGPAPVDTPSTVETPPAALAPPPLDEPIFEEIHIPASSVIGLELESTVSTETARLEDRVDARVTRDVFSDGRLAIPAGSRVTGAVTMVERGGKVKERARLGVRFHTLVLADGTQLPIRTDAITREGESPAGDSARKIGGAAVGGAILGALIGGKKGAAIGGAAGAAGGTAIVASGDRSAATLAAGSVVTVRLSAPVAVEVQKD
jgi:type IV secretory pathway VirB10-like protein